MAIYRNDVAGLRARADQLKNETARHEGRLVPIDTLERFVERDRLDELEAHRAAVEGAGDDLMRGVEALERYREYLADFIEHLEELERLNAEPLSAEAAFSPLSHPDGPAALGELLAGEKKTLSTLLRFRATEIEIEDGGTGEKIVNNFPIWELHIQARFRYQGLPMMVRAECGTVGAGEPRTGVHYRCPVAPALDELWVRRQGLIHTLWYKPVRGLQEIELGDARFDRKFLIAGYEETARRGLTEEVREALLLLRGEDPRVSLSIAGGIACLDSPLLTAEQTLVLVLPILAHLQGLRGGRPLLNGA